MYSPDRFNITDQNTINDFIASYPFATLIDTDGGISHTPLYQFDDGILSGHLARANTQSQLADGTTVTAVFHGPHTYISPRYYSTDFNVPTWNYATVHITGPIQFIDDESQTWHKLNGMVNITEGKDGWKLPDKPNYRALLKALRFFEAKMESTTATFKFNQNKTPEDIQSVIEALKETAPDAGEFMERVNA